MKSLFDEKEDWNEEGRAFDLEVSEALRPIVAKWVGAGYSLRQLQLIMGFSAWEQGLLAYVEKTGPTA